MWICICNYLNDSQIDEAIKSGADTPNKVMVYHEGEVCCGACVPEIHSKIKESESKE